MTNSIWGALDAARDIFGGLIGELLGWAIIIAVLAPFVAIVYFVLKKIGWRGLYPDPYRKKYSFNMTLGGQDPSEQVITKLLSDPRAHAEMVKLDASDPQARAKLEQALRSLEALGSVDPKIKAAMEQALQSLEASSPAQPGQPAMKSEVVFVTGSAAEAAPAILDSSAGTPLGGAPGNREPIRTRVCRPVRRFSIHSLPTLWGARRSGKKSFKRSGKKSATIWLTRNMWLS